MDEDGGTMAGFYGADTEQMRAQASACLRGSGMLRDLIGTTSSTVGSVAWEGPDADAFRERWQSSVRELLAERADALRNWSDELTAQADAQDAASAGDGQGPSGQPMPMPGPFPLPSPFPFPFPGEAGPGQDPGGAAPPYFYGDQGYGSNGASGKDGRPVGFTQEGDTYWDGREVENGAGYIDGYGKTWLDYGASTTVDEYGNTTHSAGGRAGAEIGYDMRAELPGGVALTSNGRAGAEVYGEAGVTYGDGFSAGARAGSGLYGEISSSVMGPFGASNAVGLNGFVGAEAHANVYSHATRNEDGTINGWSAGFDAGAFVGAKGAVNFTSTSPGGWFTSSASFGGDAGAGVGGNAGVVLSTDQVGFSLGGDLAVELGLNADVSFAVSPNSIVNTFTPGDYDIDDAIGDAGEAFDAGADWVADKWPF
ncbi:hypothetical protein [Brachybacterium hainanense]|uniref:WXG100 family type VII secretion target n=1 Tax=Brachybacterium hainanense TaxID=1541174 RepID=A0ABV6REX3_9MICO